eukprot:4655383-Amphidinium_carterae.1
MTIGEAWTGLGRSPLVATLVDLNSQKITIDAFDLHDAWALNSREWIAHGVLFAQSPQPD